jgi:peptide/nickel transport system permease protein
MRSRRRSPIVRAFTRNAGAAAGLVLLAAWIVVGLAAPWVSPYDPTEPVGMGRRGPTAAHWMGTDLLGRDVFSRVLHGARISLSVGLISVGIGLLGGLAIGLPAGYYGARIDAVVMRFVDGMLAFPGLLLALVVIASLGPGLTNVMIAVGVSAVPVYARLVRGSCLAVRAQEYVQAARVVGSSDGRIMFRHILPNLLGPVIVLSTLQVGSAILVGSALSYLGMGAQPPTPEWGLMTAEGRAYMANYWWMSSFPGFAIFTAVVAINLMGDGLRAALDPKSKQR